MPVFLAGGAIAEGSSPCCGVVLGAVLRSSVMPGASSHSPGTPQAVGAHAGPCHTTSQLTPTACGSSAQEGSPQSGLSNMPKYSPNGRKLSWSHSHVWREAMLDGSLIFLVLTTKSESLKGKILAAISKAP